MKPGERWTWYDKVSDPEKWQIISMDSDIVVVRIDNMDRLSTFIEVEIRNWINDGTLTRDKLDTVQTDLKELLK